MRRDLRVSAAWDSVSQSDWDPMMTPTRALFLGTFQAPWGRGKAAHCSRNLGTDHLLRVGRFPPVGGNKWSVPNYGKSYSTLTEAENFSSPASYDCSGAGADIALARISNICGIGWPPDDEAFSVCSRPSLTPMAWASTCALAL